VPTTANVVAVIPARYASTRFPGKPLAEICGVSMIERVYKQTEKARNISKVVVATDDERIQAAVAGFGGNCIMTASNHPTGTDRLAEVAAKNADFDIIVNVQGDEPLIDPHAIDAVVDPILTDREVEMSTACFRISQASEGQNPQLVKVVLDQSGFAMYFSRLPIPFQRDESDPVNPQRLGHLGLYAYTRSCLLRLASLQPTPLEQAEKLEQLRALESGIRIKVVPFEARSLAVDIPEDIAKVEKALTLLRI
jgi:3-deoxy-manno-octulosonate cytidylyltransferase (CMP-KDO synthetase)